MQKRTGRERRVSFKQKKKKKVWRGGQSRCCAFHVSAGENLCARAGKDAYWKFFFCTKAISFNALRQIYN